MTSTDEAAAFGNQAQPQFIQIKNASMPKMGPLLIREEHQNENSTSVQHTIIVHQNNASQPNLMKTTEQQQTLTNGN